MKKLLCLLLGLMLALSACVSDSGSETQGPSSPTAAPTKATEATEPAFQEMVLVDNETTVVKVTAIDEQGFWGYTLKVYLENKTDKELMFAVDSVSVNGFMCDPFWAATVAAGKKANESISFSEGDLTENGIEKVEQIQFTLLVYDSGDPLADNLIEQEFTIKP